MIDTISKADRSQTPVSQKNQLWNQRNNSITLEEIKEAIKLIAMANNGRHMNGNY